MGIYNGEHVFYNAFESDHMKICLEDLFGGGLWSC